MTAPTATPCGACLGEQFVVVEQRGVDVEVGCPCTFCPCGAVAVGPGLLCGPHEDEAELEYDRRAERRADR